MSGLAEVSGRAVEAALAAGADEAEAWAEDSRECQVRVFEGQVETFTEAGGRGLGLRVFAGKRSGYAYAGDLSDEGVAALAASAREAAAIADVDEHDGLPEEYGAAEVAGLHSPRLREWNSERKVSLAVEIERAARSRDGISQVEQTVYSDAEGSVAIASSRGFQSSYEASSAWAFASAFAGEGEDLMTGLGVGLGRSPDELDPDAIGGEAADRAIALVGARQPSSRRCPVVLDAFVAASFVGFIGRMASADAVQRGRSLFAGREGEEVA